MREWSQYVPVVSAEVESCQLIGLSLSGKGRHLNEKHAHVESACMKGVVYDVRESRHIHMKRRRSQTI